MLRPLPAHARRRGLVSQAPKAWSSRSDRRRAFMRKRNKYYNHTAQSNVMIFIFHTDKSVILHQQLQGFSTSAGPRIWTCDTRPLLFAWDYTSVATRRLVKAGRSSTNAVSIPQRLVKSGRGFANTLSVPWRPVKSVTGCTNTVISLPDFTCLYWEPMGLAKPLPDFMSICGTSNCACWTSTSFH